MRIYCIYKCKNNNDKIKLSIDSEMHREVGVEQSLIECLLYILVSFINL